MYLARTSKEMHMKSDVFCLSNTGRLLRNAVLHQGDDVVLRWQTCHLITWWCGELTTSDLTQRSGLFTRVASDLGRARQKYPCTVLGIISLRHALRKIVFPKTTWMILEKHILLSWHSIATVPINWSVAMPSGVALLQTFNWPSCVATAK